MLAPRPYSVPRVLTTPQHRGVGAWDYDPMTGEWVDIPDTSSGTPAFTVTGTGTPPRIAPPLTATPDPNANDGLPGNRPCNSNGWYIPTHRCAVLQSYQDAQHVVRIVNNSGNRPQPRTNSLTQYGADAAEWVSQNSAVFAAGLLLLFVVGSTGTKGRR